MQNHPQASSSNQVAEPSINEDYQQNHDNNNSVASNTQTNVPESQKLPSTNTTRAYSSKQKEWKAWCTEIEQFADGAIVTDEKLCLFLKDYVIPRGNINVKKGDNTKRALGNESILAFVKAIQSLRKEQSTLGINTYPTYRSELLRAFLDSHGIKSTVKKPVNREQILKSQQLEVIIPEITAVINSGFNTLMAQLNDMRTQMEESHASLRNLIAEGLAPVAASRNISHQYTQGSSEEATTSIGATTISTVPRHLIDGDVSYNSSPILPLQYKMSRNLVKITDLWREYDVGLSGGPSIKSLEFGYGTKWRKNRTESKFFSSRLVIYKEVQKISKDDNVSTEEAASKLERRRIDLKISIDKLIKLIKVSAL